MEANIEDRVLSSITKWRWTFLEATVVFDVETTGLSAIYNDLIQVAASRCIRAISSLNLMNLSIQGILCQLTTN